MNSTSSDWRSSGMCATVSPLLYHVNSSEVQCNSSDLLLSSMLMIQLRLLSRRMQPKQSISSMLTAVSSGLITAPYTLISPRRRSRDQKITLKLAAQDVKQVTIATVIDSKLNFQRNYIYKRPKQQTPSCWKIPMDEKCI